jgi:hypothetical protein
MAPVLGLKALMEPPMALPIPICREVERAMALGPFAYADFGTVSVWHWHNLTLGVAERGLADTSDAA